MGDKIYYEKSNDKQPKTELEKKYADVVEKLSERELETLRSLKGYDKEPFLIDMRKNFVRLENSARENFERASRPIGVSPAEQSREESIAFIQGLPADMRGKMAIVKALVEKWNLTNEDIG